MSPLIQAALHMPSTATTTNFLHSSSDGPEFASTAAERLRRLVDHVRATAGGDIVFVGEAAGWQGARQSGVAFTSAPAVGLPGTVEPSATAVHALITSAGIENRTLLWNAFPLHPHEVREPRTNRTPTAAELTAGLPALRLAIAGRRVLCIGRMAERSVAKVLGVAIPHAADAVSSDVAIAVRHPSRGGAIRFREQSLQALKVWKIS